MVKKGYILSETDRSILSQTVAKVNGSPLTPSKLNRRHRDQPAGGSSEYSGFFKVIDASETKDDGTKTLKVKVVDGADPAAASCGIATVNNVEVVILSKTVELVKNASVQYVYCRCQINSPSRIGGGIEISNTRPARQSDSSVTMVIARVFSENNSMRIVQDHYGEIWMPYMLECPGRES